VGQNHIKLTLQREIETGRLAHAFLFSGSRGIGKTTLARLVAKSVNCIKRTPDTSEPCGECDSCREITEGHSIDVLEIDAASHTGVDNVRESIIDSARFLPTKNKFKVFIIDEVHMLSTGAFNALLKTLEEPPAYVIFILATTELQKLPETIISRCQRFDFKKVNIEDIVKRLRTIADEEKIKIDKKVLEQIAYRSEGGLRDAEGLLGQIFSMGVKEITEKEASLVLPRSDFSAVAKILEFITQKNLKDALIFLNNLVEEGVDLIKLTEDIIELSRLILLTKLSNELGKLSFAVDEKLLKEIMKFAKIFSVPQLMKIIETFLEQKRHLRASHVPQLPLEMALVTLIPETLSPIAIVEATFTPSQQQVQSEPAPIHVTSKPVLSELETKKEEKKIEKPIEVTASEPTGAPLSFDKIKEKWDHFLKKVQEYNHSLPLILRMSQPVGVRGRAVQICVKYAFHQDKLSELKMRSLAEKAMTEVLGETAFIEVVLGDDKAPVIVQIATEPVAPSTDTLVNDLAAAFGGQVVG